MGNDTAFAPTPERGPIDAAITRAKERLVIPRGLHRIYGD